MSSPHGLMAVPRATTSSLPTPRIRTRPPTGLLQPPLPRRFTSASDAGLTELAPTANNGTATTLKVDGDDPDPGGGDLYAALRWDLSQIPAGATVTNASVTLNITNASPQTYGAYDLKKAWNESQISWNQASTGTLWATAGAKGTTDRGSQIASVTPTNIAPYTFTIPASVVQGWVSAPSSNNGILLAHTTNFDGFVFGTKEGAQLPKLTINYTTSGGEDTTPPGTTINSGPSGTVNSRSASFTFSSDEPGSTFECRLDAGSFASCSSPKDYSELTDSSHTFEVRAIDASGNTDATPASRTWTVDTSTQSDPVLVGAGDIASCQSSGDEATANLLDGISGTVFTTGDNVYEDGTAQEFANCYDPSWGRHKARTKPSVGNHEYHTAGASGYYGYFGAAAGDPSKGYYSYDLGQWHIISLNSMCENVGGCGETSPMVTWLKQDLATNPNSCTAAYFHHSLFSSGSEHGNDPKMKPSWDALYAAGAEVVLSAHDHGYERFAPQTPGGAADPAQGIREFVVGTGGKSHFPFGTIQPNSQVRNADTFGVLKLTLHPTGYDWQFVPEAGKTFTDSGTDQCHGAPGSADTTAPTVSGVAPAEGATGVSATANTEATFSEGMDPATITSSTFTLTKQGASQPLTAQVGYDAATRKATLNPAADLEASATYTATIKGGTSGVKDLAGNPLGADKTWSFSTSAPPQGSQTANLNSVADAGLTELAPTANNGTATTLKVDGDDPDPGGGDLYAALRWDLSQIPAGATVTNASVTLNITNASPQTYGAYDLKKAWNESQISWNQASTGTLWATAGAKGTTDRGSQIASVTPTNIAPYTFTIPASVVQGWVSAPSSNNGILLAHTTNFDGFVFGTKEGAQLPKLTINYTTSGGGADTTPPTVSGVVPTEGATGVSATANTEATFSEGMDPATITSSTFTLTKQGASQPLTAQVGYDAATRKATLNPAADLEASATYTATIKGGTSGVKDLAGNPLGADKTWSFTTAAAPPQDTTPPQTTIDSGPSGTVKQNNATFAFSSSEGNSTFECKLDGAAFSACVSPKKYTGLANGSHTFQVRAKDASGNIDASPASRTWTVNR